jgi:hypothetical protein
MTIDASTICDNSGTGIYNVGSWISGTMTIDASTISGNSGAGIVNGGAMTIDASTICDNRGGGIDNVATSGTPHWPSFAGEVTITASTIRNNSADRGGGILNYGDPGDFYDVPSFGSVTITDCTLSGNSATNDGGGIFNMGGKVTITDCTLSDNSADRGGGIFNDRVSTWWGGYFAGEVNLTASTISGNSANQGGGIFDNGTASLLTSVVAGNSASAGQRQDGMGGFNSLGHNLIGNTEDTSGWGSTDLLNVDPKLGPLQDNGGPTMTMALLPGSPAIDAGSNALDVDPTTGRPLLFDQRGAGYVRIFNGTVDIGAYEFLPVASFTADVAVRWGSQSAPLQTATDGLRLVPAGRSTDLPWLGISELQVTLSRSENLTNDDITVLGISGINYGPVTVSGSGRSYTITLANPINQADRVTIVIGNMLIGAINRRIDVLPGDVNDDGIVNAQDIVLIRNVIQKTGDPLMIGRADIDGNGVVNVTDYLAARKKLGSHLP